jgi:tRNA nucleotidyltransferase (CCA-adding enzyme)
MRTYLVGGAVRDELMGRPVGERDWVVVGARPEDMIQAGYKPVGRSFPVFLHPETNEEYALARTERKVAPGYHGFEFHASPDVTLEQDLARRDLTINAMARTEDGEIVDPLGGRDDLAKGLLRHCSPAFREDPVRILRLARFAARFGPHGFAVADETLELCREMVDAGEVDALIPERVWKELARALTEPDPAAFIRVLRDCGALARLFPEIDCLFGIPQRTDHHPEVDTGVHVLMALEQSVALTDELETRFAVLVHDLGKGNTPADELPRHRGHEERGVPLVEDFCERYHVPNASRETGRLVTRHHLLAHIALDLRPARVVQLFEDLDAFRKPERLTRFLNACEADARGRSGFEDRYYPQRPYLTAAFEAALEVTAKPFVEQGYKGPAIAEAMHAERARQVAAVREQWSGVRPG